jgi:uncharacterized surface protein with fasciclin (FAS1) repeats
LNESRGSIIEAAESETDLEEFVSALRSSGEDTALQNGQSYTIFAPSSAAFEELMSTSNRDMLDDPDQLSDLLKYHIVPGVIDASSANGAAGSLVETTNGKDLGISSSGNNLYINDAVVIKTDIMADNGVVHIIDKVLTPPTDRVTTTDTIVDIAVNNGNFTTLVTALQATNLDSALADENGSFTVFAPTDTAFAALGEETINLLLSNTDVLASILLQHVVAGEVDSTQAFTLNGVAVDTLGDNDILISITNGGLRYGGAEVVIKDIYASNGIIHVIDMVVTEGVEIPSPTASSIVDVAASNNQFSTLVAALQATGLDMVLADTETVFTVFAPTDAAFAELGQDQINSLLADTDALSEILLYHVLPGASVLADSAIALANSASPFAATANVDEVALSFNNDTLFVNLSEVTATNILADNGVIHVIDKVLLPPTLGETEPTENIVGTAIGAGSFNTLVAALQATGLDSVLADESQNFTVFAPTDAAFDALPDGVLEILLSNTDVLSEILLQHVISGAQVDSVTAFSLNGQSAATAAGNPIDILIENGQLTVGGSTVITTDIETTNGIIHVIDAVIVGDVEIPAPPVPEPTIVDIAVENGNFTTLVAALQATGLDSVLADVDQSFTVFAPTDAAFAQLGQDRINALLADPDTLRDILLYHVLGAEVLAEAALSVANSDDNTVTTLNGDDIALNIVDHDLFINLSRVAATDITGSNGVIHVLDSVLLPPAEPGTPSQNIVETAVADGRFTQLVNVLQLTGLDHALANEQETFTVFAPTDDAFAQIPAATLNALLHDIHALSRLLQQHVIAGAAVDSVTALSLNGTSVNTIANEDVSIEIVNGRLEIQGAPVSIFDIYTSNGVIHVIDSVITETLH